jgi:hypothetical protein
MLEWACQNVGILPCFQPRSARVSLERAGLVSELPEVVKRIYFQDLVVYHCIMKKGYATSKDLSRALNRSRRSINRHLKKLVLLGIVEKHGRYRCPHSWYDVRPDLEIPIAKAMEYLLGRFLGTRRTYFSMRFVIATIPTSQRRLRTPGRPFDASVPYGAKKPLKTIWEAPLWSDFFIPLDDFDEVAFYLEDASIEWHLDQLELDFLRLEEMAFF